MKTIICSVTASLFFSAIAYAAPSYIFVPSPGLPSEVAQNFELTTRRWVLSTKEEGANVTVIGAEGQLLSRFTIPPGTPKQRANDAKARAGMQALKKAFDAQAAEPWQAGTLQIPNTLAHLQAMIVPSDEKPVVVLLGSPLYRSKEGSFDFGDAAPSLGWLNSPATCGPLSPSYVGRNKLAGWVVHVVTPTNWSKSDWQRRTVGLYWAGYVHKTGGSLSSLGDAESVFTRIEAKITASQDLPTLSDQDVDRKFTRETFIRGETDDKVAPAQTALAPLTDLILADQSASMGLYLESAARNMGSQMFSPTKRYGMILYADYAAASSASRPAYFYSESSDPVEIAKAFRSIELQPGNDIPEALSEGLKLAMETISERKLGPTQLWIYTDAPAKLVTDSPPGASDYKKLVAALLHDGHKITLVVCGNMKTDWIPAGVRIQHL